LVAHGIAFCAAMGVAAIILLPYYPKIQDRTDTAGDAFGAFLTLCVIFGGLGPLVTPAFFAGSVWLDVASPRKRAEAGTDPLFGSPAELSRNCNKTVLKECPMRR
jgi:hypothetical protein